MRKKSENENVDIMANDFTFLLTVTYFLFICDKSSEISLFLWGLGI
jgi:hypothetical protein